VEIWSKEEDPDTRRVPGVCKTCGAGCRRLKEDMVGYELRFRTFELNLARRLLAMELLQPMKRTTGLSVSLWLFQDRKQSVLTQKNAAQLLQDALTISKSSNLPPKCSLTPYAVKIHLRAVPFYQV